MTQPRLKTPELTYLQITSDTPTKTDKHKMYLYFLTFLFCFLCFHLEMLCFVLLPSDQLRYFKLTFCYIYIVFWYF
jgi:hypothetical protein